jgi:hypothetical protein
MPDYRLFFLTRDGHISEAHEFKCRDDAEAIELGDRHRAGAAAELWSLKRRLKVYRPDPAPYGATE